MIQSADHDWGWGAALPARPPLLCDWLQDPGSLTERLRRHCRHFRVALLSEVSLCALGPSQAALLDCDRAFCREVLLYCDERPWVYASSLYSPATRAALPALTGLGQRALGELMFDAPDLVRSSFEFAVLDSAQGEAVAGLSGTATGGRSLWGRRSMLATGRARVLVTELYLPAAQAYQEQSG
ncbi:chorismate--pyruvate lyase family protein [Zobellella endophytica]|uniref:chorismate--pyruvate lyase family protein n=1 Tax=Zobellella endophytica TaxID=2116700 RepID=UPI001FE7F83D|nr:chorismate lyase [Zobellella endophytica]